ncbi:hypothetical protein SAMN02910453_2308 [Lachnospiraceae bacterium A10]|jgi:hypothetical protein|nr:hypothetical protein SAMN02910453_2308 [Lachnospiraceae bacterium A10]
MNKWNEIKENTKEVSGNVISGIGEKLPVEQLSKRKREIVLVLIVLAILAVGLVVSKFKTYDEFTVQSTSTSTTSGESDYIGFKDNLFRYSSDGAFYTDYDGDLIWSEAFEMTNPTVDYNDSYILVYDQGGNTIELFNISGLQKTIQTTLPLADAAIAENGVVAALMQEGDSSYINLYDSKGTTLASGELHTENSGYPVAIALSDDAEKLMVSMINMNSGSVDTNINFYNFGSEGQDAIDNLVASFTYSNMVVPEIDFVDGDKAIAFGDTEIVIYSGASTPKVSSEIYLDTELKSIFHNDTYFGYITAETNEKGETSNVITTYNMSGHKKFDREIDLSYTDVEMLENNEILLTNGQDVELYTSYGIKKFEYSFDDYLYSMIPIGGNNYIFVMNGQTESVKLK